jgi:hypothetical protein
VKHEDAWQRLPDLLDDRDDRQLLAHVRRCPDCQRQLFLLGRVDRLLRSQTTPRPQRPHLRHTAAAFAVAAAAVAALVLVLTQQAGAPAFKLRTASGRLVGQAVMDHSDPRNDLLVLSARGLPLNRSHVFVLWASDDRSSMQVGHFMVDRRGGCRVRFNLPATHAWDRFWIAQPRNAAAIVATT